MTKYGKNYNPKEKIYRLAIFHQSLMEVIAHNKEESTWKAGINLLSDLTKEERHAKYGIELPDEAPKPSPKKIKRNNKFSSNDLPEEVNWVEKGAVTPVRDHGQCLSGYAIAAIEAYEAAHFNLYDQLMDFSVQ